jgi:multisubunit Na+/H+ antiporter MnhF subunit
VIAASFVMLLLAAVLFAFRMAAGPTLADRMVGLNGLIVVGMGAISVQALQSGRGAFLPVLVVAALVGFVGTAMVARYLEGLGH